MNTLKRLRNTAVFLGLFALGMGLAKKAEAANPDTMTITVTPGNVNYAVTISSPYASGYNFGTVNLGLTTVSTQAIGVQNTGTLSAFYALSVVDTTGGNAWTNSTSATHNTYAMQGLFQANQPLESTFAGGANNIAGSPTTGENKYGQTSTKTNPSASLNLWLNLLMPTGVNAGGAHTLVLYVNAQGT